jgi:two-component system, sensor histidine kinase and response regulator
MGGTIGVASAQGGGTIFSFTVRFEHALDRTPAPATAHRPALRVLVVDAHAPSAEILQRYLHSWGMATDVASSAAAAIELLRLAAASGAAYDLVISELPMPEMDGFALARAIQRGQALARPQLIMLTAFDERGQGEQAIQNGFAAYLTKPVKQSQLFDTLASVLNTEQPTSTVAANIPSTSGQAQPHLDKEQQPGQLILLVEDHPVNQLLALRQLERLGWAADTAANGRQALDAIERMQQPYALILMDCQMPEMNGFAATRAIRAIERDGRPRTPIVAMTANAMQGDREECIAAGMDDYLSKPVCNAELSRVLARWLPAS